MVALVRHRQTKGSATDRFHLNHRATPRLHTSPPLPSWQFHLYGNGVNQDLPLDSQKSARVWTTLETSCYVCNFDFRNSFSLSIAASAFIVLWKFWGICL